MLFRSLPASQAKRVIDKIDEFWSKTQPGANGAPTIRGNEANAFQTWLRETIPTKESSVAHDMVELRKAIIEAFNRGISPDDAAALTMNRSQWKAWKTVEPLLEKSAVATGGRIKGNVPPELLSEAVRKSYTGLSRNTSPPPLAEISEAAGRLLVDRTPLTGGGSRAVLQQGIPFGIAGMVAGGQGIPAGLVAGLAGGTNWLLNSPMVARSLLPKTVPGRGLLGDTSGSKAAKEALLLALERSPLSALGLLSSHEID